MESLAVTTGQLSNIVNYLKIKDKARRDFISVCEIIGIDKIDEN